MKNILTFGTIFSLSVMAFPAGAHEVPMVFKAMNGQSDEQKRADREACEAKVADEVERPHPLDEGFDRFENTHEPARSGVGVSANASGVGLRTGVVTGGSRRETEADEALEEARHLQRHNAYEVAMRACMKEKGYK